MASSLFKAFRRLSGTQLRIMALYAMILAVVVAAWVIVLENAAQYPKVLALAALTFVLGLKHAMDIDHIAAIDNVTRKLVNEGGRPVGIGFFFSLGHSFVVLLMAIAIVVSEIYFHQNFERYGTWVDLAGTAASALVLYLLAAMNIPVLRSVLEAYRNLNHGVWLEGQLEQELQKRGFMSRYFKRIYRSIRSSWQMFPVGMLFGLGFDTATEMVVLAATASAASSKSLPLPLAFTCLVLFFGSMMLLDTTDSIVMLFAYEWAFFKPSRKILYNILTTSLSILIAFGIGTVEWLQVLSQTLGFKGGVWRALDGLNFYALGVTAAVLLLLLWLVAWMLYRKPPATTEAA